MREKYESLSLAVLRDLAKARNMKHISSMRKAELVEAMLAQDEIDRQNEEAAKAAAKETAESADDETRSGSDRGRSRQSSNARRV
nr:Rho termination factor N-terminal domain-containing protein [Lachnospiraceae bacterium]